MDFIELKNAEMPTQHIRPHGKKPCVPNIGYIRTYVSINYCTRRLIFFSKVECLCSIIPYKYLIIMKKYTNFTFTKVISRGINLGSLNLVVLIKSVWICSSVLLEKSLGWLREITLKNLTGKQIHEDRGWIKT